MLPLFILIVACCPVWDNQIMPEEFLTVTEAASRLRVTPYTMREWLKTKKVRGVKISQQWRVPESALTELASGQAPRATD